MNYTIPQVTSMPSQFYEGKTDEEKLEWFKTWSLFIAQRYNQPNTALNGTLPGMRTTNTTANSPASTQLGVATKMYRNYSYVMGIQENMSYRFATDDKGQQLGTNMIPGQKITQLVRHIQGKFTELVSSLDITVKAISKEALERKSLVKEKLEMKFDLQQQLAQLGEAGVDFQPKGHNKVATREDIYDYVESEQEECEIWANDIAIDCWMRNHMEEKCVTAGGIQVPVLATTAFHVFVENGLIKIELPDPTRLVWDSGTGFDTLNRNMRYCGVFNGQFTPAQILDIYGDQIKANYGAPEVAKIKDCTYENYQNYWPNVNFSSGTFDWLTNTNKVITMSVFRAYWIAADELIEEQAPFYTMAPAENKYGYRSFVKVRDAEKLRSAGVTIYQADIIAGLYTVNAKKMSNVIYDDYSQSNPILPLFVYNSSVILGEVTSIVDQLVQTQDRLDYINNTLTNMIAISMGKIFVFRRSQIGALTKISDIFNDGKTMGIAIAEDMDGDDLERMVQMGQAIDLTRSQEIADYIRLREAEEASMEKIVGLSSISMGNQDGYVSKGVQNRTIEVNSAATMYLYQGFTNHVERVLQYSTNIGKLIYSMGTEEHKMMGKGGPAFLQENTDMSLEDFGVYLKVSDAINASTRQAIVDFSLMLVQQGRISELDMLEIFSSKTISRLKAYFRRAIKQREAKQQEAEGQKAVQDYIMQQENNATQKEMNSERVQATSADNAANNEVKLADTMIKTGAKEQAA